MLGHLVSAVGGRSEIGRQAGVAILLGDQDVSRRHAVLERAGDPGDRVELRDGDEVRLGEEAVAGPEPDGSRAGSGPWLPPPPPGCLTLSNICSNISYGGHRKWC